MVPEDTTSRSLSPLCCVTVPRLVSPGVGAADGAAGPVEVPPQPPSLVPAGAWHAPGVALLWGRLSVYCASEVPSALAPSLAPVPSQAPFVRGKLQGDSAARRPAMWAPSSPLAWDAPRLPAWPCGWAPSSGCLWVGDSRGDASSGRSACCHPSGK